MSSARRRLRPGVAEPLTRGVSPSAGTMSAMTAPSQLTRDRPHQAPAPGRAGDVRPGRRPRHPRRGVHRPRGLRRRRGAEGAADDLRPRRRRALPPRRGRQRHARASAGAEVCVTVTLLDGLVLARSAFHHSMNYRSVVLLGVAEKVEDETRRPGPSRRIVDHVVPGRSADGPRRPRRPSCARPLVLRLPIEEGSVKVRTGDAIDEPDDLDLPVWAGSVPLRLVPGEPVPNADLDPSLAAPPGPGRLRRADPGLPSVGHGAAPCRRPRCRSDRGGATGSG